MPDNQTIDPSTIREFIVETFLFGDDTGLAEDTSFMESGLIDSTGILEVVDFIERTSGARIQDDHLVPENLDSIERITRFINSLAAEAPAVE